VFIFFHLLKHWISKGGDRGILLIAGAIIGSGISCGAYSCELLVPVLTVKFWFAFLRYFGNFVFILSFFFYCIWFTDLWDRISSCVKWFICMPLVFGLVVLATNSLHHLYYPEVILVSFYGFPQLQHTNGFLYYLLQIYTLCLIIATIILFIWWKVSSPRAYGSAVLVVLCGFFCPFIGYILYLTGFRPLGFLNLIPFFMFITSLLLVVAAFKYNMFSIKPIAHQKVIDALPAGVVLLDRALRIIEINPAASHFLGICGETALGCNISDVLSADDPIISFCTSTSSDSLQIVRERKYLMVSLSRLCGYNGEETGSLLLITDTTSQKLAEREVRKTANIMSSTFNSIHDGILVVGLDRTIIAVNSAFWEIWDIPIEMRGVSDEMVLLSYARDQVSSPEHFTEEINQLIIEENEEKKIITLKNGKIIERYSVPFFLDGSLTGRIWSFYDLTELKDKEQEVIESEAKYKLIMENAADLIWVLTPEGKFSFVSPSWTRIIGYPVEETVGKEYRSFVHPDDIAGCEEFLLNSIKCGERQPDPEYRVLHTDGTWHWHIAAGVPIFDSEGNFKSLIGISRDINDKKLSDLALRQANRQLNLLTSITRHDILNMVAAALAYVEFSKDIPKDPRLSEYLQKIKEVVVMIQTQIEFTKVYEYLGSHESQWQNIHELSYLHNLPSEIMYSIDCPDVSVYADPMLQKVFENLIDNSISHGNHVTQIKLSGEVTHEGFTLWYEDDGVGVIPEDKKKIFYRGFGKNTGLGLFLVREILSMTGITIQENGEWGKGVRFEIGIPFDGYRVE